jgi:hypothetical protein
VRVLIRKLRRFYSADKYKGSAFWFMLAAQQKYDPRQEGAVSDVNRETCGITWRSSLWSGLEFSSIISRIWIGTKL